MRMTRTSLSIDPEFYEVIKIMAKDENLKRADFMRRLLDLGFEVYNKSGSRSWKSMTESVSSKTTSEL